MGVVHEMKFFQERHLMVDETMHQIFGEGPKHRSAPGSKPPARVQGKAAEVDFIEE